MTTPKPAHGALLTAIKTNEMVRAKILLEQGANPNEKGVNDTTALHHMVNPNRKSFDEIAALLVEKGANIEAEDIWGHTPLIKAVRYTNPHAFRFLIEKGASPHHKDHMGRSALDWAKLLKFTEATEIIADVHQQREQEAAREAGQKRIKELNGTAAAKQGALKKIRPNKRIKPS